MKRFTRHNEVPVLERRATCVRALHYNHVQIALKRIGSSIRFRIPRLKHLDLILQEDAWIVVDQVFNDVPVIGWAEFQADGRQNLHEPIPCELRTWHVAADLIRDHTLEAMESLLGEEMGEELILDGNVLTFPPLHPKDPA
jgi:hypothetical protein